jgi:hypothetical protein
MPQGTREVARVTRPTAVVSRSRGPASAGRALRFTLLALLTLLASPAFAAGLVIPDSTSPLYRSFAAVAGNSLAAHENSSFTGNLHGNDDIDLDKKSTVTGNVSAAGTVKEHGTVTGTVTSHAPARTLPAFPTETQARALANRVLGKDTTFTNAVIDDIVFVAGDVTIRGSLNGSGTLIARGELHFEDVDQGDDDHKPVTLAPSTRMSLLSFSAAHVGTSRQLRGLLYAQGEVEMAEKASIQGVVIARRQLQVGEGAKLVFLELDTTPPTVSSLNPAAGSLVATTSPAITAAFADDLSGVDPGSVQLVLDGTDQTARAQITAAGFTLILPAPLADGSHTVALSVRDLARNLAPATWSFTVDTTPPVLAITAPSTPVAGTTSPPLGVSYSDATSGVDLTSLHVVLDGADLTASCQVGAAAATCATSRLALGTHHLSASVKDRAGNPASASLDFTIVPSPPAVAITAPADGSIVNTPSVQVTGTATSLGTIVSVLLGGQPINLTGNSFSAQVHLAEGFNGLEVSALDAEGQIGTAAVGLILDTAPPQLTQVRPASGARINAPAAQVTGLVTDDHGVARVEVAGQAVTVDAGGRFQAQVPLVEGANAITLRALDVAGNETDQSLNVVRFSLPQVAITSPADLAFIAATTVTVAGTVGDPAATVTVNGQPAVVAGSTFTAAGVSLLEGGNLLTATAVSASGHADTATISVVRDLTPPHLAIAYPQDGATVFDPTIVVSGMVNDIVAGTVNASEATVTINGRLAAVANRSFVTTVPLAAGANVLLVQATDVSGNTAQAAVTVRLAAATSRRVAVVSGDGQSGVIGTQLAAPLVAALLDPNGQPVAGQPLFFRVRGNNGSLDGGVRGLRVTTDSAGRAAAHLTLGTRAGAGNQIVEAFAPGYAGPAVFHATALAGSPALIVVDSGDQQVGIPGRPAARPLVAVVTDRGYNRLPGVPVQFAVTAGGGSFANGQPTLTVSTDSDGRAIATFTLDPYEGIANDGVQAAIVGSPGSSAQFVLSGRAAGDVAATTVSGVVLDNANQPVPGVTLRILGTLLTAQTDATGRFQLSAVPPGTVTLIVDGSTAQRPGAWPDLEYFVTVIPGRDNTVNMPIYLLPLDLAHGLQVSETAGGTLTLPDVPGFALEIAPGSVTFPGGSRSGVVSVTVVHADKVPMVPNFGQQPRLIVTIQPAGARFDPPARLTLPNVEGLAPGEVTEMYSFDHDLGHFVSIGPATVSDDGTVVVANPGVGVIKAGWHCCGDPASSGTPVHCADCNKCKPGTDTCVPDFSKDHQSCGSAPGKVCLAGHCVCAAPINFHETQVEAIGDILHFVYQWDSSTGALNDLRGCTLHERVAYPSMARDFPWPSPPYAAGTTTPNPTILDVNGSDGVAHDFHSNKPLVSPYRQASFTANQNYYYECPCVTGQQIMVSYTITRSIVQRPDGKWKYIITKNGHAATADPLP